MQMRWLMTILIGLLFCAPALAQKGIHIDSSSAVQVRHFSKEKMESFRKDIDFQYDRSRAPAKSLWQRFVEWFWRNVQRILGTTGGRYTFNTVLLILAVAILAYVILRLAGMNKVGMFSKAEGDMGLDYELGEEDIHSLNFEEAIQRAEETGNFRLGIRLLYLQTLKKLSERQMINWQINKTNTAYTMELAESGYASPFRDLTRDFEYSWYGERQVSRNDFADLKEQFKQFNRQL